MMQSDIVQQSVSGGGAGHGEFKARCAVLDVENKSLMPTTDMQRGPHLCSNADINGPALQGSKQPVNPYWILGEGFVWVVRVVALAGR